MSKIIKAQKPFNDTTPVELDRTSYGVHIRQGKDCIVVNKNAVDELIAYLKAYQKRHPATFKSE